MKIDDLIVENSWICQLKSERVFPIFGDLWLKNGLIDKIHTKDFLQYINANHEKSNNKKNMIDAGGRVLTVPLINFHDHFYSRLATGLPFKGATDNFVSILDTIWWKLDRALDAEMVRASVQMAAIESIRNGVTYIFDHHASPDFIPESLDLINGVMNEFNLRSVLCFEISDRNGKLRTDQAIKENYRFIREAGNKNIRGMIGLHAPFTLSDQSLQEIQKLQKKLNCGIHIHLAEDSYEVEFSHKNFGKSAVERLYDFGLLNTDSILAHCIHLSESDYRLIEKSGSAIVYNLDSNLNNAVGLPRFDQKPDGIPVLAGTDGMHASVARSLKQLFLLQRHQQAGFGRVFTSFRRMYMNSIFFVKRYFPDFPTLCTGDRADFILWDYIPPTPINSENFWEHYIYGILEHPLYSVIQHGQLLMHNFHLVKVREQMIRKNIFFQGSRLLNKIQQINT